MKIAHFSAMICDVGAAAAGTLGDIHYKIMCAINIISKLMMTACKKQFAVKTCGGDGFMDT